MSNATHKTRSNRGISRRGFLAGAAGSMLAIGAAGVPVRRAVAAEQPAPSAAEPFFKTRGVVLVPGDMATWPWPQKAKQAGLSTIGTHIFPSQVAEFVRTDPGKAFLDGCRKEGLEVEHELHAMRDLLPRELFAKDPTMFRMDEKGQRLADCNFCVHSDAAMDVIRENAVRYAKILKPTTGRYFYWIDDGEPMCRCPRCREFSDSDQALLLENRLLGALREFDPRATLAHLTYANTMAAPTRVKPEPGIFMEFAPIHRRHDVPLSRREAMGQGGRLHGKMLDDLDANLAVFGAEDAQVLEYWLDVSRFSGWRRENLTRIPWNNEVFLDDLATYAARGIRHVTTFAAWLDADYVKRFGEPPLAEYGKGLLGTKRG